MTRIRATAVIAVVLTGLFGLTACATSGAPESPPADDAISAPADDATADDDASTADASASDDDLTYLQRLTPVANVKKATEIRVEGNDAWVTVPVESTSSSSMLECLQLLPARAEGETLTVIFSDGVEELCEWM